ncbi:MAG TPA: 50S ribosomal protein L3, partial [Candidatus Acidoferrum sp.]|nr:50S ribosomal protein L3 [Candidatus Acidoferrum sp.]
MLTGLIGKKIGMTQMTDAAGRVRAATVLTLGQPIAAADVFKVGDQVDVTGVSKGHGYAGVIKRHHFSGF